MKKVIVILFLFFLSNAYCEPLRGGVYEEFIPEGFFGTWGVISKLKKSTDASLFNLQSKDIWTLSGYNNILILQNIESGANSRIEVDENNKNDTLKFTRKKTVQNGRQKLVYIERVEFILSGKNFSGSDSYTVEKYENDRLIKKDMATYQVEGVKISGESPKY